MKNKFAGLLPLLALAAAAGPANAQTLQTPAPGICGGAQYAGCFSASLSLTGGNTFALSITNLGAGAFTQIGVGGLSTDPGSGTSFTFQHLGVTNSATSTFGSVASNPNGLSGSGIDLPVIGVDAQGNNGLLVGQTASFSFQITSGVGTFDLSSVQIAVHQQGGSPNANLCGTSTKIIYSGSLTTSNSAGSANSSGTSLCDVPPGGGISSVPEPSTYALLGTGLLGVMGVAARRRRLNG